YRRGLVAYNKTVNDIIPRLQQEKGRPADRPRKQASQVYRGVARRASRISVRSTSSLLGAAGTGSLAASRLSELMPLTTRNSTKAIMVNLTRALMNRPIFSVATPAALAAANEGTGTLSGLDSTTNKFEKSIPPMIRPISGMKISSTMDDTMAPKAAPMITPIAKSIMLPFMA